MLNKKDKYIAFCFDEACEYIVRELSTDSGRTPRWTDIEKRNPDSKPGLIDFLKDFKADCK